MQTHRSIPGPAPAALLLAFATDRAAAQTTERASVDSSGVQAAGTNDGRSISGDGMVVAFVSDAANLVAGDTNRHTDVFVRDRANGTTERASVRTSGLQANADCLEAVVSADGRIVAFSSSATNLVAHDTNGCGDVFVHDRATGITQRVSVDSNGIEGDGGSGGPALSIDGRFVAFASAATNLVANDTNGVLDVFVHDRQTGATERVSIATSGAEADADAIDASISADGSIVAFGSRATTLVSAIPNGFFSVFVHDRGTGITEFDSLSSAGVAANDDCLGPAISGDGRVVAFASGAKNLVPSDGNWFPDVFVHDRATGTTERVSVDSFGNECDGESYAPALSADGRIVAFASSADDLVSDDEQGGHDDVFIHDRATGITARVSVDSAGVAGNGDSGNDYSGEVALSADGQVTAFESEATNLVANDTNAAWDVFVHQVTLVDASWTNYGAGFPGTNGVPTFTARAAPVLGSTLTLDLGDSSGSPTIGLLFIGSQRTLLHSSFGGDLLVVPDFTLAISIPPSGASFTGDLAPDLALMGVIVELQAVEADPGAAKGVSFTQGLELVLGR